MGAPGSSGYTLEETLAVFAGTDEPGTPLTTSEVADELDCARRTAYGKLEELADDGELETKKVGARGRVWWRPIDGRTTLPAATDDALETVQFQELVGTVTNYAIFVLDPDGVVQTWNEGAERIKGYEASEIVGEHFSRFYTEGDQEAGRPEQNLEAARESGRVEDEGWRVREDGSRFWANVTITPLWGDDDLRGYVKVTRDMTERHEYEQRIREQKDRFETLVREVKDYAIFLLDPDGVVQTWNEGARRLKGYDESEILGEHFSRFYTADDQAAGRPEQNLEAARESGRVEDEGWRVREDGSRFWANVVITALYDDGELRGYVKVTRDMTERHEYEQRLREQRDELDELNQINDVIRDIDQSLVTAASREAVEQAVCDRLADSETYAGAWTAEYAEDYTDVTPRTWAGVSDEYVAAIGSANASGDGQIDADPTAGRSDAKPAESDTAQAESDAESAESDAESAESEATTFEADATGSGSDASEVAAGARALESRSVQHVESPHGASVDESSTSVDAASTSVDAPADGLSAVTVPLVYQGVEYGVLTVYADNASAFDDRKVEVLGELGETISHALAAIRRKEREQTLTTLQESTRELLHAESAREIADVIVETLTDDLALTDALVYSFDTTENALEPASSSLSADAAGKWPAALTAGTDSPFWASFVEGETLLEELPFPGGLGTRRTMLVPLGDHGVLSVVAADRETFDEDTRNLVELVAATAEAAFDRVESQANLRERDELLQEQNERLQRLNQINTVIREVDQGLVGARTQDEVQRIVCERLTDSDRFRLAWIGAPRDADDGITPQAYSGDGRSYLDAVDFSSGLGRGEREPAVTAAETDTVTVVSNVAEDLRSGTWRKEAFSRELQSVISVPLRYGDVSYGVLSVYADRPGVFDEMEETVFAELGETIANAIDAVDAKQALLGDNAVELEIQFGTASGTFLPWFARELDTEVTVEGVVPLSERDTRLFVLAEDVDTAAVQAVLEDAVAVESSRVVSARDDDCLVDVAVSGRTIPGTIYEYGASVQTLSATADETNLTVELPSSSDVREFVEQFREEYGDAELLARRERERSLESGDSVYTDLEATLTDRQLEVLQTAYYSGFFDSPRESTGGDIADRLDVSQPTVTEHLRTAQRKLLDLLFEAHRTT